jgi:hypothetical protein
MLLAAILAPTLNNIIMSQHPRSIERDQIAPIKRGYNFLQLDVFQRKILVAYIFCSLAADSGEINTLDKEGTQPI